ncbi:MAG: dihydrolipoamide acetyltransferase family protein [Hydrogenophaga sp.]|nr:dihydrolipoamide acetyltransferase family protein [Hydrogenophaga sp.]MDP2249371.1 dihydrolipoamide acetyltransferase family protein [Hydrogenophaga sp.]
MVGFTMPALGADMESGQVVQWLVKPGDRVRPGDVVAVVETHKGAIDVECFLDGVIDDLVPLGQSLPVGAVLAQVRGAASDAGVAQPAPAASGPASIPEPPHRLEPARVAVAFVPTGERAVMGRVKASPAARRLAREQGVDIAMLPGHGAGGAVVRADVQRAIALRAPLVPPAAGPPVQRLRPGGFDPVQMRQAIALAMARSKREIPHYYLEETFDLGPALQWVEAFNRDRPPTERLLPAALLLKAVAVALRQVPRFNGFCVDGGFQPAQDVHVGWAIALRGGGLVAPAIHHADRLDLPALMAALRDLVQRARAGGLRSSELTDPTITVTSLGDRGAARVQGVIYPPQVAIVGFGRVRPGPWVQDGTVTVRPLVHCSLAADHRTSDGHLGSQFLAAIAKALLLPEQL